MTNLLGNNTISMILTVPHVKELTCSIDNTPKSPPSIPIYHGSIIHIEQHENTSDLIVRVPNFHHISIPSVTITINDDQFNETPTKRRAPICPILEKTEMKLTNAKRFAIGLRNLRRTIITTCKSKRSTNINEITIIPVLPDVEVIAENLQRPMNIKKTQKNSSKLVLPKIFFIKRKNFKFKKNQPSTDSIDNQTNTDDKTNEDSLSIKENENEGTDKTDTQMIPISLTNPESISAHHYSGLSLDTHINNIEDISSFIKSSTTIIENDENIEEGLYVVHPNGDTYSECYEITYEIDPDYREKEQIYLPEIQDESTIKFNLNPFEYQDLTPWLPIIPSNNYEQIDQSQNDLSQISNYQPESISIPDNNQLMYLNDPSIIDEDYTVIIQYLRRALQIETDENELE